MTGGIMAKIFVQPNGKANDEDRLALATLLIKLGYTVRLGKERREGQKQNVLYVEYKEQN
jgi:hypothetical protein